MKPPLIYYGGKSALASTIARYAPHRMETYLETYFGSGAVFFYKHSWARTEIINDLNGDVVNFFRVLRDNPQALIEALALTPSARQEIQESTKIMRSTKDDITRALYFFVRANQSFSGNMSANGGWHVSLQKDCAGEWIKKCDSDYLYAVSERLRRASIDNNPATYVLQMYDDPKTFVYHDPPYLAVASSKDKKRAYQGFDMTDEDHAIFLQACLEAKSMQIISGYDHPIYDMLTRAGWKKVIIPHHTNAGNRKPEKYKNSFENAREEILWISPNVEIPIYVQKSMI